MDICRAPCSDDHDGPEWFRITCEARQARDRAANTSTKIKEAENEDKEDEMTDRIIEMYKAGKSYERIAEATGKTVKAVQVAVSRYRMNGHPDLPRRYEVKDKAKSPKKALGSTQEGKKVESPVESPDLLPQAQEPQAFKASEPEPEPAITDAAPLTDKAEPIQAPAVLPTPSTTGLDPSSIHSLIDIALKLKKDLLRYAEELETAALYIQSMAKEIREKMSA